MIPFYIIPSNQNINRYNTFQKSNSQGPQKLLRSFCLLISFQINLPKKKVFKETKKSVAFCFIQRKKTKTDCKRRFPSAFILPLFCFSSLNAPFPGGEKNLYCPIVFPLKSETNFYSFIEDQDQGRHICSCIDHSCGISCLFSGLIIYHRFLIW